MDLGEGRIKAMDEHGIVTTTIPLRAKAEPSNVGCAPEPTRCAPAARGRPAAGGGRRVALNARRTLVRVVLPSTAPFVLPEMPWC